MTTYSEWLQDVPCTGKRRYGSRIGAKKSAKFIRNQGGDRFRVYRCDFCDCFHLGHRPGHATHLRRYQAQPSQAVKS